MTVLDRIREWLQPNPEEPTEEESVEVREDFLPPPSDYPQTFSDFIGQEGLVTILRAEVRAALKDGEKFPHMLLYGPPGTGKTSIAFVLANELGGIPIWESTGAEYPTQKEVIQAAAGVGKLLQSHGKAIWLLDEADGLSRIGSYPLHTLATHSYIQLRGEKFYGEGITFIATTNRPAGVPRAFRSRMAFSLFFDFYNPTELAEIARRAAQRRNQPISDELASWVGQSSAGEPRKALHLLRALRVLEVTSPEEATKALAMAGLRHGGLSKPQYEYLTYLRDVGGTAGLNTISAYLSLDAADIRYEFEQYLIRSQMVKISGRGRTITEKGLAYLQESS